VLAHVDAYAVFSLCRNALLLVVVLHRDSLLSVDRLSGHQVLGCEEILLATAGDEDTLVTMGLDDNLFGKW
jgi:hypothetical protein